MNLACLVVFAILANRAYAPYHIYWGDVHGHSALSDGNWTPDDYFTCARDVAELDFVILTDDDLGNGRPEWRMPEENWTLIQDKADQFNANGHFVAIAGYEVYDEKDLKRPAESSGPTPRDGPWHRTFVDCVKEGRQPPTDIEPSHKATVCSHLGNIAYHTQRTIRWDGQNERILGDNAAAAMLSRPRRAGYELPEV